MISISQMMAILGMISISQIMALLLQTWLVSLFLSLSSQSSITDLIFSPLTAGNITSVIQMLSPGQMFLQMMTTQSVNEQFNGFPYVAILSNCILWVLYQSPAIHPDNILVLIINIIGIGIQVLYLVIAFSFGRRRTRISILIMVAVEFLLIGMLMAFVFAGVHALNIRVKVVGWACVASGVLMYGSTFPVLIDAWRMMSTDNIPLPLILAGLADTTIWLTTGFLENNIYVLVQNGCGLFLVILQVGVYILIWICNRSPPTANERAPPTADSPV